MIEVAEIFRLHGESYRSQHCLSPWQLKAMADIEHCRTAYFGGHLEQCDECAHRQYTYHSCANRHCPKCHGQQTERWLERQEQRLLPCAYYLLTVTLPAELRPLAWAYPKQVYGLFMSVAAAAVQKLARDPQWIGGVPAILAVLHTWTRAMLYHVHVHLLVSAGGLSPQGHWQPAKNPAYLMPDYALRKIVRAKFKAGLKRLKLPLGPPDVWKKKWVINCRHAGSGHKVLNYLGRYVFRIAICNSRLEKLQDGQVTFRYRERRTQQLKHCTLGAEEFIQRFLQHVLPKGFVKVRAYGLGSPRCATQLQQAKQSLLAQCPAQTTLQAQLPPARPSPGAPHPPSRCPKCQCGHMIFIGSIRPQRKWPP